jgi:hypothetical protein
MKEAASDLKITNTDGGWTQIRSNGTITTEDQC